MDQNENNTPSLAKQAGRAATVNFAASAGMVGGMLAGLYIAGTVLSKFKTFKTTPSKTTEES